VEWQSVQSRSGICKKINPSKKSKNSNRLTDGQEHKNIYASNAIEQQERGLNWRSSKPSCNQSADGNWDQWQVNSTVTKTTLQQSAGGNWEGRQSQASIVVYAETFSQLTHTQTLQSPCFKISTYSIGKSVMEGLSSILDASTCWHWCAEQAAGNTTLEKIENV
jgi:hypothetical protein